MNKGTITARKNDFYVVSEPNGDSFIIESSSELELDDTLTWSLDDPDMFYSSYYDDTLNCITQWHGPLSLSKCCDILRNQ